MKKIALLAIPVCLLAACSDNAPGDSEMQVSGYTVPPLSEDPPMSGSDIDAITREIEARNAEEGGAAAP